MTETINKETVEGALGAVGTPNQPASGTQAAPSAVDEASLKAILEPLVQAEVEKRTQSVKDKRISKQESRISNLEDTLAELKALRADGMSEKQAVQYIEMKEFLASQGQDPSSAQPVNEPAVQPQVAADGYLSTVLKLAGLTSNDPDVVELLRKERDPVKQITALGELSEARKQVRQTPPNPAATMPMGGGQTPEGDTLESVSAELNALYAMPVTPATRQRIQELGKKNRELLNK
jgi:hypothetical protein